jgi:hypothetical protein
VFKNIATKSRAISRCAAYQAVIGRRRVGWLEHGPVHSSNLDTTSERRKVASLFNTDVT